MKAAGTVAAIDLGATSGRVIVGDVGADTLTTRTVARFPNTPVRAGAILHWDVLALYEAVLGGLREAFRETPDIASIGIDSWAVDYALLRDGRLLGVPVHYRDERTSRGVAEVHRRMPHAELFARNGLQFLPFTTLYQFAAEPPEVVAIADSALMIPDLIAWWLTGVARAEVTNASTTGLLRWSERSWDAALIDALGLLSSPGRAGVDALAPLIEPGTRVGALQPHVASAVGGQADVVAVGSHDTASAVVAVPMQAHTAAYISCGTWGLVGVEVEDPVLTDAVRDARFTNEGGVDGRVRLLRNVMGLWLLSETIRQWERSGEQIEIAALLDAAGAVPASSVPVFDVDDPRFLPPGDIPARIDAWCAEHGVAAPSTRAQYARSIVESLAQAFADSAFAAARLGGIDLRTIHVVGGGALNALLCQRTADRAGVAVLAGPVEATAIGNVLVQARAAGFVEGGLEDLRALVGRTQTVRRFEPRRDSHG